MALGQLHTFHWPATLLSDFILSSSASCTSYTALMKTPSKRTVSNLLMVLSVEVGEVVGQSIRFSLFTVTIKVKDKLE